MHDASLATPPNPGSIDLRHLDGVLTNLRRAERDVASIVTFMAEARDRLAVAPDEPEARHAVRLAGLRMRGAATALAQSLAALAQPDGATA